MLTSFDAVYAWDISYLNLDCCHKMQSCSLRTRHAAGASQTPSPVSDFKGHTSYLESLPTAYNLQLLRASESGDKHLLIWSALKHGSKLTTK